MDLLYTLDDSLPDYLLDWPGMIYIPEIYGLWQALRCNPYVILLLSWPLYFWHRWHRRHRHCPKPKIVWLDDSYYDYDWSRWQEGAVGLNELKKLQILTEVQKFCMARYGRNTYVAETSNVKKFQACLKDLGEENIVFVERPLKITSSLFVAKKVSCMEAAERVFSSNQSIVEGAKGINVVLACIDYVQLESQFWGVLSGIPILLQAKHCYKLSALVGIFIILLDISRGFTYKLYDNLFDRFTKFVKLNLFKKRTKLYLFFSIFSSRWGYSDLYERRAYMKELDKVLNVRYAKLESEDHLQLVGEGKCSLDPPTESQIEVEGGSFDRTTDSQIDVEAQWGESSNGATDPSAELQISVEGKRGESFDLTTESQSELQNNVEVECGQCFAWVMKFIRRVKDRFLDPIINGDRYQGRDRDRDYYVEIEKDRARWKRRPGIEYAKAITKIRFYVL